MGNLAASIAGVDAVEVVIRARKDDAGARSIAPVIRPASTDRAGTDIALGTTYQHLSQCYPTSPETASAWTVSEVNGSEFGVKVTV